MKRVQLFEFEDFQWFPGWLRTCMTNLIVVFNRMMGVSHTLAKLIADLSKKHQIDAIVDLGAGAGGAMPEVMKALAEDHQIKNVKLTMTDMFPNADAVKKFSNDENDLISYSPTPVDATNLSQAPKGIKTMINCFHHMRPEQAKAILKSASESKEPLLIYELTENKMPLIIWWLFLPVSLVILVVMCLFMTPFVRPLTWQQVVFTYIIPILPFLYAWDGQASMPRMYAFSDLDEMLKDAQNENYTWSKGFAMNKKGKKGGTYLIGMPI
jgi:hypothetical protein